MMFLVWVGPLAFVGGSLIGCGVSWLFVRSR
jgi:hypothetical protein